VSWVDPAESDVIRESAKGRRILSARYRHLQKLFNLEFSLPPEGSHFSPPLGFLRGSDGRCGVRRLQRLNRMVTEE
jgi:hypothetical protein